MTTPARPGGGAPSGPAYVAAAADGTLYLELGGLDGSQVWRRPPGGSFALWAHLPVGVGGPLAVGPGGVLLMADDRQVLRVGRLGTPSPWPSAAAVAGLGGQVWGLCASPAGRVYAVAGDPVRLWRLDPSGGATRLSGVTPQEEGALAAAQSQAGGEAPGDLALLPQGPCAADDAGTVWVAGQHSIERIAPDGSAAWVAGDPWYPGYADGVAAEAQFGRIAALALDARGDLWIADAQNQRIRVLTPTGLVYTAAGGGSHVLLFHPPHEADVWQSEGFRGGDRDGPGPVARFDDPQSLVVSGGRVFVADGHGGALRVLTGSGTPYPPGEAAVPLAGPGLVPAALPLGRAAPGPVSVVVGLYAPVAAVRVVTGGGRVVGTGDAATGYGVTWDASGAAAGTHTLTAQYRLGGGPWTAGARTTVDLTPGYAPFAVHYALITPGKQSWVRGRVELTAVGDGVPLKIQVDGHTVASGRGRILSVRWNSATVADGVHSLGLLHGVPEQGKTATDHFAFHVINGGAPAPVTGGGLHVYAGSRLIRYSGFGPRLVAGVPYLPFAATMKALGFRVSGGATAGTVAASRGNHSIRIDLGTGVVAVTPPTPPRHYTLKGRPVVADGAVLVTWQVFTDATGLNSGYVPAEQAVFLDMGAGTSIAPG